MIIIDLSSLAFSAFYAMHGKIQETIYRHLLLNTIRSYNVKYRDKYGSIVIACDGWNYWRKSIFPHYKAARAKNRETDGVDWDEAFRVMNTVRDEIRDRLPFKFVHLERAEADDIIATLCQETQEFGCHEEVLIISSDGDFAQLQKYKNVSQLCPKTKKMIKCKDPVAALREKIIRGDGGDGVPNVLSPEDAFVTGTRQTVMSAKRFKTLMESWGQAHEEALQRRLIMNEQLISLDKIPDDVKTDILNTFRDCKVPPKAGVFTYLIENRCGQLVSSIADFYPLS